MQTGVIYIHGNPGNREIFRRFVATGSANLNQILVDLPGIGYSDLDPPKDLDDLLKECFCQVKAFIEQNDQIYFISHDWGVPISLSLASRYPNKTKGFVIFNTAIGEFEKLPKWLRWFKGCRSLGPIFLILSILLGAKTRRFSLLSPYLNKKVFNIPNYVNLVPFDNPEKVLELKKLGVEKGVFEKDCLIVWGLKDPCLDSFFLADVFSKFKKSQVILTNHSHFVSHDLNPDEVDIVFNFLKGGCSKPGSAVSEILDEAIRENSSNPALYQVKGKSLTPVSFKELNALAYKFQLELRQLNLSKRLVLLAFRDWKKFVALFIACLREECVPVLMDPKVEFNLILKGLKRLPPFASISNPIISGLLTLLPFRGRRISIVGEKLYGMTSGAETPVDECLFIAFTSGGTGVPKPVVFTEQMVLAQVEIFRKYLQMSGYGVDMPITPAFFIYSMLLGRASILSERVSTVLDYNYSDLLLATRALRPSHVFASKYFWSRFINTAALENVDLSFISYGVLSGAPIYRKYAEELLGRFSGRLIGAYGSTEALPVTFYDLSESLKSGPGLYVGKPIDEVKVVVGESNQILVSGPNISKNYLSDELNEKFKKNIEGDIFHNMSDVGSVENGDLYILGRAKDSIPPKNLYPYPIEDRIMSECGIESVVIFNDLGVNVFVESTELHSDIKKIVSSMTGISNVTVRVVDKFPRDLRHNSKVLRDKLKSS